MYDLISSIRTNDTPENPTRLEKHVVVIFINGGWVCNDGHSFHAPNLRTGNNE